ncbi:MAG: class I SAM-dependent methyltransferase [Rudaea sp.]
MNDLKTELQKLYADASKHSVYQNVPDFVSAELGYNEAIDETWRGDRPRLAYLITSRAPIAGERWLDFGANTGFFTLSLAKSHPQTQFTAVEVNPNHAHFIARVAQHFGMNNVEVIQRSVGLNELESLPRSDCMLHLNVLHHAGHDFDANLVPERSRFAEYAVRYLGLLRARTDSMFFQIGSNWGGDKQQPLVAVREDREKLDMFSGWLRSADWHIPAIGYATRGPDGEVHYEDLPEAICKSLDRADASQNTALQGILNTLDLDRFPGEFYRRPLFVCSAS